MPFSALHLVQNTHPSHRAPPLPVPSRAVPNPTHPQPRATATTTMPDTDFVLLESSDGYTFTIPRRIALASGTLKAMLDEEAAFKEAEMQSCKLHYRCVLSWRRQCRQPLAMVLS